MVKLNYTNRKIDGLKLGHVVAKDLLKRIPPGTAFKAALRDPCVELEVPGKSLTDDGFKETAAALVKSVEYEGEHGKVVKLEELCFKGNQLTAQSLLALSQVVKLAANELRDLDLSDNLISIKTSEEAAAWEILLIAFSGCCVIRRIDFSGNPMGPRAFEVLARVYGKEEPVDLLSSVGLGFSQESTQDVTSGLSDELDISEQFARKLSLVSESDGYVSGVEDTHTVILSGRKSSRPDLDSKSPEKIPPDKQPDLFQTYSTTKGLRSTPYLIFSNTAMNEACALHLSYIIASHKLPDQLLSRVPSAKAGPPAQQLDAYDLSSGCRGVVYLPNPSLDSAAIKVLELSELARSGFLDGTAQEKSTEELKAPPKETRVPRRSSEARANPSPHASSGRRRSATSIGSAEQPGHGLPSSELDRARSRIQGNTLRDAGPHSNDLWSAALKTLALGRVISRDKATDVRKVLHNGWEDAKWRTGYTSSVKPTAGLPPLVPLAPANANQHITAKVFQRRKDIDPPSDLFLTPPPPPPPPVHDAPASPWTIDGQQRVEERRDRNTLPGGLTEDLWRRIIALAVGADDVLSEKQQLSILRWAMDRGTLQKEMEVLGKPESAQIWKVLEGMGCLCYDIKS